MTVRDQYLAAFRPSEMYAYSFVLPFEHTNDIDSMAWVGCVTALARRAHDLEVVHFGRNHLASLILMGEDTRNFGKGALFDWEQADRFPDYTRKIKPQAFAGPAMYEFCRDQDIPLPEPGFPDPRPRAELFCTLAPVYGVLLQWFGWIRGFRQHVNSVLFAHLLLCRRAPRVLHFLAKDNPLYSYICGLPCEVKPYPNTGDWPAKDWPRAPKAIKEQTYTPACSLAGEYAQEILAEIGPMDAVN